MPILNSTRRSASARGPTCGRRWSTECMSRRLSPVRGSHRLDAAEDDPTFADWIRIRRRSPDRYRDQDPEIVAAELEEAAKLRRQINGLTPEQLVRTGRLVGRRRVHRGDVFAVLPARRRASSVGRDRPAGRDRFAGPRVGRPSSNAARSARQRSSSASSSASASSRSRRFSCRACRRRPMSAIRNSNWPRSPGCSS